MCVHVNRQMQLTFLMSSKVCISGESPPCTHRNCWFMSAAKGRQSNASMHESYTCSEYLILPADGVAISCVNNQRLYGATEEPKTNSRSCFLHRKYIILLKKNGW